MVYISPAKMKSLRKIGNSLPNYSKRSLVRSYKKSFRRGKFGLLGKVPRDVFGSKKTVVMRYHKSDELTSSTTEDLFGTGIIFNLNSLSNPISSQGSGSPLPQSMKEIVNIYKHAKVYGVTINAIFSNPTETVSGNTGESAVVGIMLTNSQDASVMGSYNASALQMKQFTWVKPLSGTGTRQVHYKQYIPLHKLEGLTRSQFNNDISQYEGTLTLASGSGNPSKIPKLHIAIYNNLDTLELQCQYELSIDYHVKLYDRVTLATSSSTS